MDGEEGGETGITLIVLKDGLEGSATEEAMTEEVTTDIIDTGDITILL